jgi:hypothetical protein
MLLCCQYTIAVNALAAVVDEAVRCGDAALKTARTASTSCAPQVCLAYPFYLGLSGQCRSDGRDVGFWEQCVTASHVSV